MTHKANSLITCHFLKFLFLNQNLWCVWKLNFVKKYTDISDMGWSKNILKSKPNGSHQVGQRESRPVDQFTQIDKMLISDTIKKPNLAHIESVKRRQKYLESGKISSSYGIGKIPILWHSKIPTRQQDKMPTRW
jgi:hypothetical protein